MRSEAVILVRISSNFSTLNQVGNNKIGDFLASEKNRG